MATITSKYPWFLKELKPIDEKVTTKLYRLDGEYGIIRCDASEEGAVALLFSTGGAVRETRPLGIKRSLTVQKIHLVNFQHYIELK